MDELPTEHASQVVSVSPNATSEVKYTGSTPIVYEENEKQFLSRLASLGVLPKGLSTLREVLPESLSEDERSIVTALLANDEKEVFTQSILAYGWFSYTLAVMGLMRVLESCVELLYKQEKLENPKPPNPPSDATIEVCVKCEVKLKFFSGLQARIEHLSLNTKKQHVRDYLVPVLDVVKRHGQAKKHVNSLSVDKTDARQLIATILSILKSISYEAKPSVG